MPKRIGLAAAAAVVLVALAAVLRLTLGAAAPASGAPAADEALDPTFGSGGKVTTGLSESGLAANAVAVDGAGRIVAVGGHAPTGVPSERVEWLVTRYLANGAPDGTFDGDGRRIESEYDCGSEPCEIHGQARAVLPLADGRIVVAGDEGEVLLVARYLAGGQLDPSFGEGGFFSGQIDPARRTVARGLAAGPFDSVLVLVANRSRTDPADERFDILRLDVDGAPDGGFGDGGTHQEAFAPVVARAIVRQPSGRILVAGYHDYGESPGSNAQCFVARYWANGAGRDGTFGENGIVRLHFDAPWMFDMCTSLALTADGRVAVAGMSNERLAVGRLTAEGLPDESFSTDGRLVVAEPSGQDSLSAEGVGVDPSGRIVVGGTHWISGAGSRFLALRVRSDGVPDATFGPGGIVETAFDIAIDQAAYGLAVQPNGRFIVAGRAEDAETWSRLAMARYTNDGGSTTAEPTAAATAIPTGGGTTIPTATGTDEAPTATDTADAPTSTPTPTGTPAATGTATATVTIAPTSTGTSAPTATRTDYTVRGRVTLERRPTSDGARVCMAGVCSTTDTAGAFVLQSEARGVDLVLTAAHPGYLRTERPFAPPAAGATVDVPAVTLVAGDVNDDGQVEVDDAAMIGQRFRLRLDPARPDPLWLAAADITDDGVIDILDLVAVQFNLRKVAPSPWP